MKLRLPHKLQAALIATLASVSLTTLSTGGAYAVTLEDAALKMDDFTQASVDEAKAAGWTFSDAAIGSSSTYTTDVAWGTITHDGAWTTYEGNKKRAFFSALLTFNVTEGLSSEGVLLEAQGATAKVEGIGYTSADNVYKVGSAWTGGYRSAGLVDKNLANYADANGLVTVAIIYKGDASPGGCTIFMGSANSTSDTGLKGTDDPNGNPTMYLASTKGVEYTNLYLFGMANGNAITDANMQSMIKAASAYYWNGSADAAWTAGSTNWNHYGSSVGVTIGAGNANTNVVFGASGAKTVGVEGSITVGDMAVESAGYAFNMADGSSLTVEGTASIDHTIQVTGGTLTLNGQINVGTGIGLGNYDVYQQGTITYTDGANGGFMSSNTTQYYLVQGTGATVDGSYTFADAGVAKVDGIEGSIVFTYNPATPAGVYYILASQSYDATKMGSATEFMVEGNGVEFTAAGINLAGKALTLDAGTTWKTGSGGNFNNQQLQKLTLLGDAKVNPAVNGGIIGASDGETFLDLQGHTLTITTGGNHFALFNTTALSSGTITIENDRWLQIGHSQKTSSARLNDVVINFGGANAHLTIDCNSSMVVEGLTGNGTIQKDGGTTPTLTLAPTLENASYTFTGKFTAPAKLVMDKASTGTQAINVSTASTLDSIAVHGGTLSIGGTAALTVSNGVTVDGGTLALGSGQHSGIASLTISDGGKVTTSNNNGNGFVAGTVTINAGGTLQATGGQDIFGYKGGQNNYTDKVVMQGSSAEKQAKIDLTGVTGGSVTMTTDLEMKGHSTISGGTINSFGGNIAASGTNNTISGFAMRDAVTIDVAAEGTLEIGALSRFSATSGAITKDGGGTLTLKGGVIDKEITMNAGALVLDGTFTVDGLTQIGIPTYEYAKYDIAGNGVRRSSMFVQFAGGAGSGNINTSAAEFIRGGETMYDAGDADVGFLSLKSKKYSSTFYINGGAENTQSILAISPAEEGFQAVTGISIADGATLVVNDGAQAGFNAGMITVQSGTANLQILTGNTVNADGTNRALQLSGAGTYKLNSGVGIGSLSTAEATAATPWTGTIDATAIGSDKDKLFALYTTSAVHGGTVLLKTVAGDITKDNTALELQLGGKGKTEASYTFAQTTFKTEGSGNLRFSDYDNNHTWVVGSGTAFEIGGGIRIDHRQTLSIQGGSVTAGGKVVLGHSGSGNAAGLNMTSGSLKTEAIQVIIGGTGNAAPISITGGTLEFTSANPLQLSSDSTATVTLGGSGDNNFVTLKADTASWALAHNGMTIGNITAETTGGHTITLGAAGKVANYSGELNITGSSNLTLAGTIAGATAGASIAVTGALTLADSVVFDLSNFAHQSESGSGTYTIFTGNSPDLTRFNGDSVLSHITGSIVTTGRTWSFTNDGKLTYTIDSRELWWMSYSPAIWTSEDDSQTPWTPKDEFAQTYFHNGDSVKFSYVTGNEQATLGSNVTVATMTLDEQAGDVTVNNGGSYSFSVEELDILHGRLTTNTAVTVKSVNIASGAEWALGGTLNLDTVGSFNNEGVLRVLNGVQLRVHKSNAESYGTVTADAGGTLYVDNGSGQGDAKYTYHGSADAPFKGTLVYDILSSGNHDVSIALENFQGTLELRGRLAASASSFGGMTMLVLNGDRSSNTTGLWNQNAFTLDVPVDIVGESTVDLFTSAAMTINGAVNGGTEKRGHLGKQNTGALTFNGAVTLLDFTTAGGSVTFNAGATMDAMTINGGTVTLNGGGSLGDMHLAGGSASVTLGGADKDYSFNSVKISSGNLSVAESGVNSLTAGDLVVRTNSTLSSAAANPTVFNVTNFDVSNYDTNFTLRNVTLNVSGEATAAVLNTGQNVDQATVTVGDKATLNLDGSVVWKKVDEKDATKTDYVNLVIASGGTANVNAGAANILNNVTVNAGGKLSFGTGTTTTVAGTIALADTITNAGTVTINGGSVAAGQAGTLTGSGTYNLNGTITNNGTLQLADATFNGAAGAAITGNVAIHGGLFSGSLAIGSSGSTISVTKAFTVEKGASLNLSGADALILDNLEGTVATYSDGVEDPTNNGFLASLTGTVFHYLDDSEPEVICPLHVTYHGVEGRIWPFSGEGVFSIGGSKATFYVNTATETEETYSHAKAVGADTFTMVELANGTGFNIDSANAALSRVTVKAGAAASLTIGGTGATIGSVETGNGLSLTGEGTLTLGNAGGDHSLNGAGTLTINGPTVTINGTNNASFTGNIDVLAGTLKLGDSTGDKYVLGAYNYTAGDTRTITIHTGATLDINGKADANYVLTLDGGRFTNNSNTDVAVGSSQVVGLKLTANSYVGDSGHGSEFWLRERTNKPAPIIELNQYNLTKQGTGTFGLHSTTVTGTGYLVVEEGTVKFDGGSFGANFRMAGGAVTGTVNLTENTTIDATEGTTSTFAAVITGTGKSVTKTGEGTLTLSGANTYTGGTTISAGTLVAGNAGALGTGAVTIAQGGNLVINAAMSNHTANSFNNNGGVLTMQNGSSLTMQVTGGTKTFNLGNVVVNGSAGIAANTSTACYNALFNMTSLSSGSDGAEIVLATGAQYSKATVFDLDTNQTAAFNGTITVKQNNTSTSAGRPVALNLTIGEDAKAAEILKGSVIKLDSAGNANALVGLGLNSDVTVKGIDSGTAAAQQHAIFAGKATTDTEAFKSSGDARTLTIDTAGTDHSTHADVLDKINLVKKGAGTQVFSGDMSNFNGSVEVEGGVLNIMNAASVNVTDVTISNSTLGVYSGATATAETDSEGTLTIKQDKALTASGNATLNANLVMETGATLDVTGTSGAGLALGSSVTLNTGMTLNDYGSEWSTWEDGATYTLFTGVDGLNIGSGLGTAAIDYTQWVDAQQYFENIQESNRYFLCYGGAPAQNAETLLTGVGANGSNVGMVYIMVMPEPTTGTLSLLALCALAARRRRK